MRNERMRAAGTRQLGEAIREATKSGAARHGNDPECGGCDAGTCVQAVQKQH
jgi:hypothetical protein